MSRPASRARIGRTPLLFPANSGFIINPAADTLLIIGAPLLSLVLCSVLFWFPDPLFEVTVHSRVFDLRRVFIFAFVNAHTFVMFFRSHANKNIFSTYPLRFTAIPLIMIVAGVLSSPALMTMGLIIAWWDIYHAGMQTFGFGRIYDSKMKNDPNIGRTLDWWMNFLIVTGPVLSGVNFVTHLDNTRDILNFMTTKGTTANRLFLYEIPDFLERHQPQLKAAIVTLGVAFVIYYILSYYRLAQQGYKISWQKVWLLFIASIVSIYIWGFRSFVEGFWVQNFFHCLQYFAIVIFTEHRNVSRLFRVSQFAYGSALAIFWVISFSFLFGLWASTFADGDWSMSLLTTTAILHYWYDGFIWSVKKKQV